MGGLMGGAKPIPPPIIEAPKPPPEAATPVDASVKQARDDAKRRAAAKSGYNGTILTGDMGAATTSKTILGG